MATPIYDDNWFRLQQMAADKRRGEDPCPCRGGVVIPDPDPDGFVCGSNLDWADGQNVSFGFTPVDVDGNVFFGEDGDGGVYGTLLTELPAGVTNVLLADVPAANAAEIVFYVDTELLGCPDGLALTITSGGEFVSTTALEFLPDEGINGADIYIGLGAITALGLVPGQEFCATISCGANE